MDGSWRRAGNIKQRNKRDGLIESGSVFMHRKLFGCKSVTQLNDLSQSLKIREQSASASSGTLSDFSPHPAFTNNMPANSPPGGLVHCLHVSLHLSEKRLCVHLELFPTPCLKTANT